MGGQGQEGETPDCVGTNLLLDAHPGASALGLVAAGGLLGAPCRGRGRQPSPDSQGTLSSLLCLPPRALPQSCSLS